jgi:hypothetical protein
MRGPAKETRRWGTRGLSRWMTVAADETVRYPPGGGNPSLRSTPGTGEVGGCEKSQGPAGYSDRPDCFEASAFRPVSKGVVRQS